MNPDRAHRTTVATTYTRSLPRDELSNLRRWDTSKVRQIRYLAQVPQTNNTRSQKLVFLVVLMTKEVQERQNRWTGTLKTGCTKLGFNV